MRKASSSHRKPPRKRSSPVASSAASSSTAVARVPPRYFRLFKPYGVLSQFTGDPGQDTLARFGLPKDVYAAGRLDRDSEGLLILSNDGPFIKRLLDPDHGHQRTYYAQVEGVPETTALEKLAAGGIDIKGHKTRPCRIMRLDSPPDLPPRDPPIRYRAQIPTCWLSLTLCEGKNRQVRRMTAAIGHPTLRLVRVAVGKATLEGLTLGAWDEMTRKDIL